MQSLPSLSPLAYKGFTQQMLPIEMSCTVFYCVKKHTVNKYIHPKIIRPPFALPEIAANKYTETNIRVTYDGIEIFSIPFSYLSAIYGKRGIKKVKKFYTNFYIHQIEEKIKKASNNFTASVNANLENIKDIKLW